MLLVQKYHSVVQIKSRDEPPGETATHASLTDHGPCLHARWTDRPRARAVRREVPGRRLWDPF